MKIHIEFKNYLVKQCQVQASERVLVAVSGGMDSVLLCHLLKAVQQPFGMAHCNFKLRGKASDGDEVFVQHLAKTLGVSYFVQQFDTYKIAIERKESIQVVARDLRYEWLENTRKSNDFHYLATAHHLNDSVETVLFNLTKGCGIRGLHGILPRNNQLIRPLLFLTKMEIRNQVGQLEIDFRIDDSNESDKYTRNYIRHQIVPNFQSINPKLEHTFAENINRFREVESLYFQAIESIKKTVCKTINDELHIDIQTISENNAAKSILFEILKPYNFTNSVTNQILQSKDTFAGKLFYSKTHLAVLDRTHLIVGEISVDNNQIFEISENDKTVQINDKQLIINYLNQQPKQFSRDNNIAYFDADKLQFPLKIRKWKEGDIFQPFGMKGKHKKVSEFFRQQKFSKHDKDKVWILESDGEIVWIIGYRSDERFKVDKATKNVMILKWE
ncbi:MAG: tRNA lysidine(34) synthetase TilS [Saprospiraceae bacterium]